MFCVLKGLGTSTASVGADTDSLVLGRLLPFVLCLFLKCSHRFLGNCPFCIITVTDLSPQSYRYTEVLLLKGFSCSRMGLGHDLVPFQEHIFIFDDIRF